MNKCESEEKQLPTPNLLNKMLKPAAATPAAMPYDRTTHLARGTTSPSTVIADILILSLHDPMEWNIFPGSLTSC